MGTKNVIYLGTAAEVALLEAYRRCCARHRETILWYAEAGADRCTSGRADFASCCACSVAPVEPARPQPARLTLADASADRCASDCTSGYSDLTSVLARRGFEERRAAEAAAEKWQQLARRNKRAARPRPGPTRLTLVARCESP